MERTDQPRSQYYRYWTDSKHYQQLRSRPLNPGALDSNGRQFGPLWKPPALELVGEGLPCSDFPFISLTTPVLSERAFRVLSPLLEGQIEAFPCDVFGEHFYIVN